MNNNKKLLNKCILRSLLNKHSKGLFIFNNYNLDIINSIESYFKIEVSGWKMILFDDDIRHMFNKHGNITREIKRGQIALKTSDILKILNIINNYDYTEIGNKCGKYNTIIYVKKYKLYILKLVLVIVDDQKKLQIKTMWKKSTIKTNIQQNPSLTSKTDNSMTITSSNKNISYNIIKVNEYYDNFFLIFLCYNNFMNKKKVLRIYLIISTFIGIVFIGFLGILDAYNIIDIPAKYIYLFIVYSVICLIIFFYLAIKWNCISSGYGDYPRTRLSSSISLYDKEIRDVLHFDINQSNNFINILKNKKYINLNNDNKTYYKIEKGMLNTFVIVGGIEKKEKYESLITNIKNDIKKIKSNAYYSSINIGIINIVNHNVVIDKEIYDIKILDIKMNINNHDINRSCLIVPFIINKKNSNIELPNYLKGPMIRNYEFLIKIVKNIINKS